MSNPRAASEFPSSKTGADLTSSLLDVALEVACAAAEHVRTRRPEVFGPDAPPPSADDKDESVRTKSTPTDPVTIVDTETEQVLRELLASRRSEDAILGEEGGGRSESIEGVRWVLDPIDGTVNFLYGIPAYAISVAAQIDGVSVVGVVVDVARGFVYSASRGGGAYVSGPDGSSTRLRANPIADVSLALVATGFGYSSTLRTVQGRIIAELLPQVRDIRRVGSAALDLCMVASGAVDAHFEHGLSPWDWAAGSLIAEEAGAVLQVPSPSSSSSDGAVTVAVAPAIAEEFTALLGKLGALESIPVE